MRWLLLALCLLGDYPPTGMYAKPVVTLYTTPGCGPCETMKKTLAGMKDIEVKIVSETVIGKNYPQLTMPGKAALVGAVSEQRVREWLK